MYVTTIDNKYHKKFIPIILSQTFQDIRSLLHMNWVFQYVVYPTRGGVTVISRILSINENCFEFIKCIDDLLVIIRYLQPLEFKRRILASINNFLVMHILHSGSNVFGSCRSRCSGILFLLCEQSNALKQRRRYSPHNGILTRPIEIKQSEAWNIDLIFWWRNNAVYRRFEISLTFLLA